MPQFNLASPLGMLQLELLKRFDRVRSDRGASAIEWVIISAILAGLAVTIGIVIVTLVQDKANTIDLENPSTPGGGGGGGTP